MDEAQRILVIDDQRPVAEMLLAVLQELGYEVRVCVDAERAVQRALAFQPHLVILDLVMPGLSGKDVLRELRAQPATAQTPVLLVTAYHAAAEQLQAHPGEGVQILEKPFDIEALVARVRQMIA
ncbi:MAG: response regulator [Chloroflexi bacterium]|nr:response regulator [Chloroflexota bacterium]